MNDTILRALMQLVALVAQYNRSQLHSNAHVLIKTYLEQSQGRYNARVHLKQFYDYFQTFLSEIKNTGNTKNGELDTSKIATLCQQIAIELQQSERVVLFFSFLELINIDRRVTPEEYKFTDILAEEFNIDLQDYQNATNFIYLDPPRNIDNADLVVIADYETNQADELEGNWVNEHKPSGGNPCGIIHRAGIGGKVYILRIKNANFYALKYIGNEVLFINRKKIRPSKFYTFNLYDTLKFSQAAPVNFYDLSQMFRSDMNHVKLVLSGDKLCIKDRKKNVRVHPFSFSEESGHIVSVVGPSETTSALFRVLSAYAVNYSGKLSLNGYDFKTEHFKIFRLLGYVPGKPVFQPDISVKKNIFLIAKLHFPAFNATRIAQAVDLALNKCHLHEYGDVVPSRTPSTEFTLLHARLLNLAIELVRDPLLIIVENPLDGLSASDSELILDILRNEVERGCLVLISSAQPNSPLLKYSERIWIFDEQGYIIFNGSTNEVFPYFQSFQSNFAGAEEHCPHCGVLNPDVLSQVIQVKMVDKQGKLTARRKITPLEWHVHYKERIEKNLQHRNCKKVLPIHQSNIPNIDLQYYVYLMKTFLAKYTRLKECIGLLLVSPLVALFLSVIFRNDWSAAYHFGENPNIKLYFIVSILFHIIYGFILGEREARLDSNLIEHHLPKNISYFSYINAKITWLFPVSLLSSLLYAAIGHWVLGINCLLAGYWLVFFSLASLGNVLGSLFHNYGKSLFRTYFLLSCYLAFCLIFSGSLVRFDQLPKNLATQQHVPVLAELSPIRWAFEALAVDQVKNNDYESNFYEVDKDIENAKFNANHLLPALQNIVIQYHQSKTDKKQALKILQNELNDLPKRCPEIYPFEYKELLTLETVTAEILDETSDYLTYLQMHFYDRVRELTAERNNLENQLIDSLGKDGYREFKSRSYNPFLYDMLAWAVKPEGVILSKGNLIKMMNPVFLVPSSNLGRAHFFSPVKHFNGYFYQTIWFNILVIWMFSFVAYILLLFSYFNTRR